MKTKYIIALFILGIIVMIIGGAFKIMHWPGAGILILSATGIKLVAAIIAICKVLTTKQFKDFLDN